MKQLQKSKIIRYFTIILALEIVAVSINFSMHLQRLLPVAPRVAILVNELTGVDRAITVLVVNIIMIVLSAICCVV